jgi:Ca-activated chloride channel family protein
MHVEIDEDVLMKFAANTGGKYFRATNTDKLTQIYQEIGELEKTKIEVKEFTRYDEFFGYFLGAGLLLFVLEIVLGQTVFRKIP